MEKSRIKPKTKLNMQSMLLSLRCNWQRQLRSNKQLVLIAAEVKRVQISCWQHDCCLWQKEKSLEQAWLECSEEWWQELEEALDEPSALETALTFVDQDAAALVQAIGEPLETQYEASCSGPGDDGVWTYDGFTVYTYRENGVETIVDAE